MKRTECNNCKHRRTKKTHCSKDNLMKQDETTTLCIKFKTDFTIKRNIIMLENEGNFSDKFLSMKEERNNKRFYLETDFQQFLNKGGAWDFSVTPSKRLF